MDKYIGLDVHATSCTAAIVDARGKRLGPHVLETNGQVLVEFFKTLKGALHVCMEEGTQAGWLVEILSAHVERVVTLPESRGAKSDERDAFGLAERLRTGAIDAGVYKQVGPFATLRQLTATGFTLIDVHASVRWKSLELALDVLNLSDTVWREGQFEVTSRLPKEAKPVDGVSFTPGWPRELLALATVHW